MIVIIEFKKYIISTYIFYIVLDKLSYWKESNPIFLLVVDKSIKINFYFIILPLSLAINKKKKCNKKFLLDF